MRGHDFDYTLSLDADDPALKEYEREFEGIWPGPLITHNTSVVEATNIAAQNSKGDILIYLTDDFECPPNWVELINERIGNTEQLVVLKVDDCLQQFRVGVLTIPIMTRALYKKLGYFFHPSYKSMHVDVDLYETCKRLNVIKYCPDLKFPHHHVSNGKAEMDETYRRSTAHWNQGLKVMAERRRLGFPI